MKKTILISVGIFIFLIVLGVWVYLFMYGTPKDSGEVFARFGFGGETRAPQTIETTTSNPDDENTASAPRKLRQLSLRPVAGATFTGTGILYVEQGTGYIYHLNFGSGAETLISGTTIPEARSAHFSPGGGYVAITTTYGTTPETIVGSVTLENGTGSLDGVSLPLGAQDIYFSAESTTLMYTLKDSDGTSGYTYNLVSGEGAQIFKIPLRDVRVLWGIDSTYVYTTPSATQLGGVYRIENNNLEYVTQSGFGLMGISDEAGIFITTIEDGLLRSSFLGKTGKTTLMSQPLIPEKCVPFNTSMYCAVPFEFGDMSSFPDAWYKGVISFSDTLWSFDTRTGISSLLSDFLTESGREIDVGDIGTNDDGSYIYFINKNDNTLWMFDTTL